MKRITGKAKGGVARAKSLTPGERKTIARRAAASRWETEGIPRAICSSENTPLRIANITIDAYVLEDGTRILSQAGFLTALGRNKRATGSSIDMHPMLRGAGLEKFITPEILEKGRPISFRTPQGLRANGYRAELLPIICEIYLKARDANTLSPNQKNVAVQADILMRGLATVGIISLVDEATGYQELRAKNALTQILQEFVAKELQPWIKTFPDEYYRQLFKLRGLEYPRDTIKKPQYFGTLTNEIIYKRLAPGVLAELKRVTPRDDNGRPSHKHFQRLTSNKGYPALRELLGSVVTGMDLTNDWLTFMTWLDRRHPKFNAQLPLPMEYDAKLDDGKGL